MTGEKARRSVKFAGLRRELNTQFQTTVFIGNFHFGLTGVQRYVCSQKKATGFLHVKTSTISYSRDAYSACLIKHPPVFTSLCCKLVSDQLSILFGSTNRRHAVGKRNLPPQANQPSSTAYGQGL